MNKAIILGRLAQDPKDIQTSGDNKMCAFTLATSEKKKEKEYTEYHDIICFGKTAENCLKFLEKGKLAMAEGKIQTRVSEKDGKKHYNTQIVAYTVQFL